MPTYALGRNAVLAAPGVSNDNVKDATLNVNAEQLDVTVFGGVALTESVYMAGLVDATVDVTCTMHSATVGQTGTLTIASLPNDLDGVVLSVSEKVTPRGVVEYTVSYGMVAQD